MDVSVTAGSDVVQAFRLIGNWAVASKGWSIGVSGSLVAEAGLQIMIWCWIISSNDFVVFAAGSRWVVNSFVMHIPCHLVILVYVTLTM